MICVSARSAENEYALFAFCFRVRDKRQRPTIYIGTADRTCDQLLTVAKRDTGTAVVAFEYK